MTEKDAINVGPTSHWGIIMGILLFVCGRIQLRKPDVAGLQANISLIILIIIALAGPTRTIHVLGFIAVRMGALLFFKNCTIDLDILIIHKNSK